MFRASPVPRGARRGREPRNAFDSLRARSPPLRLPLLFSGHKGKCKLEMWQVLVSSKAVPVLGEIPGPKLKETAVKQLKSTSERQGQVSSQADVAEPGAADRGGKKSVYPVTFPGLHSAVLCR